MNEIDLMIVDAKHRVDNARTLAITNAKRVKALMDELINGLAAEAPRIVGTASPAYDTVLRAVGRFEVAQQASNDLKHLRDR